MSARRVLVVRGPYLRENGVNVWRELSKSYPSEYEVDFVGSTPARHKFEDNSQNVIILKWLDGIVIYKKYTFGHILRKLKLPHTYLSGLRKILGDYDIVHASEPFTIMSLTCAVFTKGDFYLATAENINQPRKHQSLVARLVKKYVYKKAVSITTTSPAGRRALIHEGVSRSKIKILPNSSDVKSFYPKDKSVARSAQSFFQDEKIILFVGRLTKQKGIFDLKVTAGQLFKRVTNLRCVLIGQFDSDIEKIEYLKDFPCTVTHLDEVKHESLVDYYNSADVFVMPSITMINNEEQFCMAVLEAMLCSVPVIVSDVGGLPYVVDYGRSGMIFREGDTHTLSKLILACLETEEVRDYFEKAKNESLSKFDNEINIQLLREIYAPR